MSGLEKYWEWIIVSHRRHIIASLPYLPLLTSLPNEASKKPRIDRNRQFGIFFSDVDQVKILIDRSIIDQIDRSWSISGKMIHHFDDRSIDHYRKIHLDKQKSKSEIFFKQIFLFKKCFFPKKHFFWSIIIDWS